MSRDILSDFRTSGGQQSTQTIYFRAHKYMNTKQHENNKVEKET
jgi:hypothetical protein